MADDKNYADDFVNTLHGRRPEIRRGLPPLHPREGDRWVNIAAETGAGSPPSPFAELENLGRGDSETPHLLTLPKTKLAVRYRQFSLAIPEHCEKLEEIMNNCVSKPGWIMAREEWDTTKEGDKLVTVKYMEPVGKKNVDKATREREDLPKPSEG